MAKTWATLRTEIKNDMNLHGEDFVSDAELLSWVNDGIERAEKEIVSLYDKYFETDANIALVTGTSLYSLPSGILGNKITHIEYSDGVTEYEVKFMKLKKDARYIDSNDRYYTYRLRNDSVNGTQIELFPPSLETSSTNVKIYFIREANRISEDTDTIEIPLAQAFIKQYIKDQVKEKELGPMFPGMESDELKTEKALMIEALNNMIPDDTRDQVEPDTSFYEDIEHYDYY